MPGLGVRVTAVLTLAWGRRLACGYVGKARDDVLKNEMTGEQHVRL